MSKIKGQGPWYLHCYTNNLRDRLGSPAVTIGAQQIEDTTALLHRLTPNQTPLAALRAVAMLRDIAAADATHATVSIATTLHATAARRAITHAPDNRFDADPLRVHVTRHWYLHSYLDHLQTATRARQQPLPVSNTAERQVTLTLASQTIHPLLRGAASTLTTHTGQYPNREVSNADPGAATDPWPQIIARPPEEAAQFMFGHPFQLHSPRGHNTKTTIGRSKSFKVPEPPDGSESNKRTLPPRIA